MTIYKKAAAAGLNQVRDWCVRHVSRIAIVLKNFVVHRPLSLRETAVSKAAAPLSVPWQQGARAQVPDA